MQTEVLEETEGETTYGPTGIVRVFQQTIRETMPVDILESEIKNSETLKSQYLMAISVEQGKIDKFKALKDMIPH